MLPLLSLQAVTKIFSARPLFEEISLVVAEGEKVALIGPNGAGKSTLLKTIVGAEHLDGGEISFRKGLRLAHVAQQDNLPREGTVFEILSAALSGNEEQSEARVSVCMGRGGFFDKNQPVSSLSGGWRKRLAILCALIQEPELLLLDEPTNHLDIDSIIWLEEQITAADFAVLFISHDRYFIESVAQRVVELDRRYPKGYLSVDGRYSDFISTRLMFLEQLQSYRDALANRVRFEAAWLKQGAKARTTKAKGRIKEAHRLMEELEGIDLQKRRAQLEFAASGRKSKELLKVEGLGKAFGDRRLFKDFTLTLSPGSRLGVVGSNGSGKTTLLRTLLGEIPPDRGTVWHAPQLRSAFFDQNRKQLNPKQTLLQALCNSGDAVSFNGRQLHVTSWARRFLFRPEQFTLPVGELSGGEQARLLIAQLMLLPADLLVLDEPTNDLDISTLEVLEEALTEFAGAVILVTHDRYLLDRVSTSVVGLPGNGRALIFADYTQWEICRDDEAREAKEVKALKQRKAGAAEQISSPRPRKLTYAERLELGVIEEKIMEAEARFEFLQKQMSDPVIAADAVRLKTLCEELNHSQQQVEAVYARWHELEQKQAEAEKS